MELLRDSGLLPDFLSILFKPSDLLGSCEARVPGDCFSRAEENLRERVGE